jgi:hypothetical protein
MSPEDADWGTVEKSLSWRHEGTPGASELFLTLFSHVLTLVSLDRPMDQIGVAEFALDSDFGLYLKMSEIIIKKDGSRILGDKDLEPLLTAVNLKGLWFPDLLPTFITDEGIRIVARLTDLVFLDFGEAGGEAPHLITERAVSDLRNLKKLEFLRLPLWNFFSRNLLRDLCATLPNCKIHGNFTDNPPGGVTYEGEPR